MEQPNEAPAVCDRLLVYSNGAGRTKQYPWPSDLPVPKDIEVWGVMWHLIADTKVIRDADETQSRVRAWNATRSSKEAA